MRSLLNKKVSVNEVEVRKNSICLQIYIAIIKEVTSQKKQLILNIKLMEQIIRVANWLAEDRWRKRPGLILSGNYGTGKKTMINVLLKWFSKKMKSNKIRLLNSTSIINLKENSELKQFFDADILAIYDVGLEQTGGYAQHVIENCIKQRIMKHQLTIISTIHTLSDLHGRYDIRVIDDYMALSEFILYKNCPFRDNYKNTTYE